MAKQHHNMAAMVISLTRRMHQGWRRTTPWPGHVRKNFVIGIKRVRLMSSSQCASGLALFELDVDFCKCLSSEGAEFTSLSVSNSIVHFTAEPSKSLGRDHVAEADLMVPGADLVAV